MRQDHVWLGVILLVACALPAVAQQSSEVIVPPMVNFSGTMADVNGRPLTGLVGVTFNLYKDQQGGAPLWMETQNVQADRTGHYSVMLGSTTSHGLPADLFASGEARWLGVQVQGQEEQPRVMLLSVPYALKAGDAQTLGGLLPSAFVLAGPPTNNAAAAMGASKASSATPLTSHDVTTTGGTVSTIPLFSTGTNIQNSIVTQSGTTAVNVGGNLNLHAQGRFEIGGKLFAYGSYANNNAFVGFAGNATTTAIDNTASGFQALQANTTGNFNTATGQTALLSNTTGGANTAIGAGALYHNVTGSSNTADGFNALTNNAASDNNAFGYEALASNTNGSANDAFGYQALFSSSGSYNDAFGYQALYSNTTGLFNIGNGFNALYSNTSGSLNTAMGAGALFSNTTATDNTAIGNSALYFNTSSQNTANGSVALYSNTTGANNTASGYSALYSNTTGADNVATGFNALYSNTTGNSNTAVGILALFSNTTGTGLTCIGSRCTASNGVSNATAIGANAVVEQSNSLVLGGTGSYAVKVGIGTTVPSNILTIGRGTGHPVSDSWETYSSRRWKANIHPLQNALSKVQQLRGVSYDLKDSGKHEIGVIAEEVGQVVPEVVSYEDNGNDARGVDYSRLTALLIEAVKQQQKQITAQQRLIRKQQRQISGLGRTLGVLETSLHAGQEMKASLMASK